MTPASHHLYQLKNLIYSELKLHDEAAENMQGFTVIQQEKLRYSMELTGENALALLQMTPFAWRASSQVKVHIASSSVFECDAYFMVTIYKKDSSCS